MESKNLISRFKEKFTFKNGKSDNDFMEINESPEPLKVDLRPTPFQIYEKITGLKIVVKPTYSKKEAEGLCFCQKEETIFYK